MTVIAPERRPGVKATEDGDWEVIPEHLGPTWEKDPFWEGPRDPEGYILPVYTLGWQAITWIQGNLLDDESDEENEIPLKLTNEQMRFILWFYAIDENGRFIYREVVLQRLKGWGKDPLAAAISAVELVGPCRFAGWLTEDMPELGLAAGDPYAKPHPRAWVQIAAVALVQTQNTMMVFRGLFSKACKVEHSIDIGMTVIYAYHGNRKIEAVTSSPASLEGNRPTLVIKNETHHWKSNNDGIAMADAIERNATKAKGGAARTLSITNAYEPSEESVARMERESWEKGEAGLTIRTDMMYDSLEAPKDAGLKPWKKTPTDLDTEDIEDMTRRYLARVLEAVRGDAWWLDVASLVSSILNPRNKPSRSRRFWYNQIVASEDAWVNPAAIKAAISQIAEENRMISGRSSREVLEAGWIVAPEDPIVMFFDGSKNDDSTALVGCRLSDGYVFTIGVWQKPKGEAGKTWLAPREAVDRRVNDAMIRFNVVAFWGDPSHAKDDLDSTRYWDGMMDAWMRKYTVPDNAGRWAALDNAFWPVKSGHRLHAIMFDMTSAERSKLFVAAAEEFVEEMETLNDIEEYAPSFQIDGHPALLEHLENAHRFPTNDGISLMKEGRESAKKIDLAVCAVGARMLRKVVLNKGVPEEKKAQPLWGFGY